jgi:hypothetical protein
MWFIRIKYEKKKYSFCILKVTEERSRIRNCKAEVRIRICTKMSLIPNTASNQKSV